MLLKPISGGGGDPEIEFPEASPEERALQAEQVQLLRDQRDILSKQIREQQLLAPILFKSAGIEPIFQDTAQIEKDITGLKDQQAALREKLKNTPRTVKENQLIGFDETGKELRQDVNVANPALAEIQNQIKGLDTQIANQQKLLGNKDIVGFRELEDPNSTLRKEIETGFLQRSRAALRGELPVNPALLRDLRDQEETLRESLRKQLGPGFETSTPGRNALTQFGESREGILEGSRRGDLSLAESLGLAREGGNQQRINEYITRLAGINQNPLASSAALGGNAAGYNPLLARLLQAREGQFGANAIQFQYDADDPFTGRNLFRSFQTDARTFGGAAAGGGFSTARVKKDIEPTDKEGAEALKKLRATPLFKWRYLWDDDESPKRMGPILELSPSEIKERDGVRVNQIGYSALLHAGVKELDREVRTLRQMVGGKR